METNSLLMLLALLMGAPLSLNAQEQPTYALYRYDPGFYNPAALGTDQQTRLAFNSRSQLSGIENAPRTQSFYLGVPDSER